MKKVLLFLICCMMLVSCDTNKDDIPKNNYSDCKIKMLFNNVSVINGTIYTTQDYSFELETIEIITTNNDLKYITQVEYIIDSNIKTTSSITPFMFRIDTRNLTLGEHELMIKFNIMKNDGELISDFLIFNFNLVKSTNDLPNKFDVGTYTYLHKIFY